MECKVHQLLRERQGLFGTRNSTRESTIRSKVNSEHRGEESVVSVRLRLRGWSVGAIFIVKTARHSFALGMPREKVASECPSLLLTSCSSTDDYACWLPSI